MTTEPFPYYWRSLDWEQLMADYPPPPLFTEAHGRYDDERLRALQERRFLARVEEAWSVAFYRDRWKAAGLHEGDIRGLDDLTAIPPFTTEDLRAAIDEAPPFGTHHPFGRADFGHVPTKIQTSGGTTGMPRFTLFDPLAWEVQGIQYARALHAQGGRPGDVVQIPVTTSLANMAWAAYVGTYHWLGGVPATTGSGVVTASERQMELARALGTTGWVAMPEYLGRLAEAGAAVGIDVRDLPTRWIHTYLGPDPDRRLRGLLEETWGAPVYDNYGSHEIGLAGFECVVRDLMHVNEDTVLLEILDRDDGTPVGWGEQGNLVATSLHRSVPPFIRYNLRDVLSLQPRHECACGLTTVRMSSFQARSDEMVKLRGQAVYPSACADAVQRDERTTGEYLCVVQRVGDGLAARTEMVVRVERRDTSVDRAALSHDLAEALRADLGVRVDVEIVEAGELAPLVGIGREGKPRRLLKLGDA